MAGSQSKTFWSFLILVDVLLLVAFGWALADRLYSVWMEPVTEIAAAPLPKAKPPKPAPTEVAQAPAPAPAPAPEPVKEPAKPEPPKKEEKKSAPSAPSAASPGPVKAKKVVFSYKNRSAKKVAIEGTFTKWNPMAMSKGSNGEWRFTTFLLPGFEYPYRFVVDGKMITDPTNPKEKWGKSLMPVK